MRRLVVSRGVAFDFPLGGGFAFAFAFGFARFVGSFLSVLLSAL
jgi:hypothetical protein